MPRSVFGKSKAETMRKYGSFVRAGIEQGQRKELTGGGLIRSLGGWTEVREALKGGVHIMRGNINLESMAMIWTLLPRGFQMKDK